MSAPFFDTNIVIDWLKRFPQATAELALYSGHRMSRIVWTEVLAGESLDARTAVRRALANFEIVELDEQIAAAAADLRFRSKMKLMDAYILATAQTSGAVLITRNTKDFPADMHGVRVPYAI